MIARLWRGSARPGCADAYLAHLQQRTFPELRTLRGHRGAQVLRRASGSGVDFVVVTYWDSIDVIRQFSGDDTEAAVVPAEAQALLASYDDRATHWEVALDNPPEPGAK